jgi:hypothetical protein
MSELPASILPNKKTAVDQRRNQFLEKERVSFGLLGQYRHRTNPRVTARPTL